MEIAELSNNNLGIVYTEKLRELIDINESKSLNTMPDIE